MQQSTGKCCSWGLTLPSAGLVLYSGVNVAVPVTAVIAFWQGANIIRTHDVRETVQALCVCAAARAAE